MNKSFTPDRLGFALVGDESLTIACGDILLEAGHWIGCVITRAPAVRDWAMGRDLPVRRDPGELPPLTQDAPVDWVLSIANLRVLPDAVLRCARLGAINFHDGPLPERAGLNTPAWALLDGADAHGVTWHLMEGGVDEGDVLVREDFGIDPDETALTLNAKCYAAGLDSFADLLRQMEKGRLDRQPQDLSKRRYFTGDARPERLGLIDGRASASEVLREIRALDFGGRWNPLTLPKLMAGETLLCIGSATASEARGDPGAVLAVTAQGITLGCAEGALALSQLMTPEGKPVDARDHFTVGDVLAPAERLPDAELRATARHESHWRRALAELDPLAVPFVRDRASGARETVRLRLPEGAAPAEMLAAAGLAMLRGAGRKSGDMALHVPRNTPLLADWVPLGLSAAPEQPFAEIVAGMEAALSDPATQRGFFADLPARDPEIGGLHAPPFALSPDGGDLPAAPLCLALTPEGATLHYTAGSLTAEELAHIRKRIETACARAAEGADVTCADVWPLPEAERRLLLEDLNDTATAFDQDQTIHGAFAAQAERTPDAIALVHEGQSLSYAALDARANRVAHVLRDLGAGPGVPVGLCCERGLDLVVGALGILRAGAAYVPLDPAYPADRLAHFMRDSEAPILLLQNALRDSVPESDATLLAIDRDPRIADAPESAPAPLAGEGGLAYLIYTSGSTGTPKGVMVGHENVANFFAGMNARIDHEDGAVWLSVTSLSFDISVLELFWTLARGFKVVLMGDPARSVFAGQTQPARPAAKRRGKRLDFNLLYWGNDDGVGPRKYELLLEGAKFADAHGFNAVWTPERHFHAFGGPYPNPSVTGAAVAAVTRNIAVRAGSCVAPLHHPARIAEEWAVIDNLTNGRVGLAIANGWQPDDFVLRPENTPPDNKPAMYTAIEQLRALWAGESVAFPRADGSLLPVVTQPRPVSRDLPIWVTTAGNPQTWKEAGEIGANVLTHLLGQTVAEVAEKIGIYHEALRKAGHDPQDHRVTVMLHSYLAETREAARDVAREPMKDYLRSAAGLIKQYAWAFPAFKKPAGASSAFDLDLGGLSGEEMDAILDFAFERYFNDSGMFGTVEDGLSRAEELRAIGVDEVACLIDYGVAPETVLEGLKPLAEVLARANPVVEEAAASEMPEDMSIAAQIRRHGVTHLQCTPSMAQMLLLDEATAEALSGVRHLMLGGEALPGSLVNTLRGVTDARIQNMYGPTETTIWSTTRMLDKVDAATAPIGTPIANTQVYVLDDNLAPLPAGAPGELWIGGAGVTAGYWKRTELTEERFRPNPFGAGRIYKTGDLVSRDLNGVLHYLGRADDQVKIRGHRIELGEIEARLAQLPGVRQAVVTARETSAGRQLVGYVTTTEQVDPAAARAQLAQHLPQIMVPAFIVTLDEMPLTPNRKIDRKALPAPGPKLAPAAPAIKERAKRLPVQASEFTRERTQTVIAKVWEDLLGVSAPQAEDNFFSLGGHSLLAVQAHRDIGAALGTNGALSVTDIFRFPTLGALAKHLASRGNDASPRAVKPQVGPFERQPTAPRSSAPDIDPETADIISRRRKMRAARAAEPAQ